VDGEELKAELRELPLRAIVAFAARCARRVEPLVGSRLAGAEDLERAIALAEQLARGMQIQSPTILAAANVAYGAANRAIKADSFDPFAADAYFAYAAANAAYAAANAAAYGANAVNAAADAANRAYAVNAINDVANRAANSAGAANDAVNRAAYGANAKAPISALQAALAADQRCLATLNLGEPKTLGRGIDPSPTGPLGPLWPEGEPEWFVKAKAKAEAKAASDDPATGEEDLTESNEGRELIIELDVPESWSDEDAIEAVRNISLKANAYHHALCGQGLRITRLEILDDVLVPEGSPNG
jgi:hypothetical protein